MKQALGICIWVGMLAAISVIAPLVASTWNATMRSEYVSRGIAVEWRARMQHWRIYHIDIARMEMDCGGEEPRRARVLDLPEFDENPREFLTRTFPECRNIRPRGIGFPVGESWLVAWPD